MKKFDVVISIQDHEDIVVTHETEGKARAEAWAVAKHGLGISRGEFNIWPLHRIKKIAVRPHEEEIDSEDRSNG